MTSSKVVLDASALLAFLHDEPGFERVEAVLNQAVITTVNLAEVVSKLTRDGFSRAEVSEILEALALEVAGFDLAMAYQTGYLSAPTQSFGLSLGDRACLAFAKNLGLPAMTADRIWKEAESVLEVQILVIR